MCQLQSSHSQSWLTMVRAAVGCYIVGGWIEHWCTDVFWVWWILNLNAAVLLQDDNIRDNQLLHRDPSATQPRHPSTAMQPTLLQFAAPRLSSINPFPVDYTGEAPADCTGEAHKYYSSPSYAPTTGAAKYYAAPTSVRSCNT